MLFVVDPHALEHLDAVGDGRFIHLDGLEAAFQGLVLLDILAVLGEGGGADDLDLPAGEGGFHDIGGVHGPLRVAHAHQVVQLVDEEDDVAGAADLADEALDPLLKLAAELGACHQGSEVQQVDFLVCQAGGDFALHDVLGNALGDGRLAHARLTDEAGVVFLAAAEDLDGAVNFPVAADDVVDAAFPGFLGQVFTVIVQELALLFFVPAMLAGLVVGARLGLGAGAEGEHRASAGDKLLRFAAVLRGHHGTVLGSFLQEAGHALLHVFQVLIRHAEALHQIIHRLNMHFPRAGQAVAFLDGFAVLHTLDKHHGGSFFTTDTKHRVPSLDTKCGKKPLYHRAAPSRSLRGGKRGRRRGPPPGIFILP